MGSTPYMDKELLEYKAKIKSLIVNNEKIMKLMSYHRPKGMSDSELIKNRILPFNYIPETVNDTDSYLMYDVDIVADDKNSTLKRNVLYFWITNHHLGYCDENGVGIPDQISLEIKNMLEDDGLKKNLNESFGITLKFKHNRGYSPQYKLQGRQMLYYISDFADGRKYGA